MTITLLSLVSKVANPIHIFQFGPINLYSVVYKTVTKVIVNKLKDIILNLVEPTQTSFIPSKHITKNVVIA